MRFSQVWFAALVATAVFQISQALFVVYLTRFASLSGLCGAFGWIMALLLWSEASVCMVLLGACLCAALASRTGEEMAR